jgi:polyisoprenyl-phosphate glycosyltransferase
MDLSIIVPVYNGEKTLDELHSRIVKELDNVFRFEILFIFDCGRDCSWNVIEGLVKKDPVHVRGFHLKKNYGQHNAIMFGLARAEGEYVVTMDEDLQHDPCFIIDLLKEQRTKDFDVVYGRFEKLHHPGPRIWTSETLRNILSIIVPGIYYNYSPYRLMKKSLAREISGLKNSYTFIDGYIGWTTNKISCVSIKHYKRADGTSSYSYFKLMRHALLISIAYSKLKTILLFLALLLNLVAFCFYAYNKLVESIISTDILIVFFMVGITLLVFGLTAEWIHFNYLKRNRGPILVRQ